MLAVDPKLSLDDNSLYRHPKIQAMRDLAEEAPLEIEASKFNLNYIKLDGSIACLVNGAGLAMATMDIIQHFGGRPANFLDVGGGASQEQVAAAFKIILQDPNVKGILVNIFGGIMDCNVIAGGIVAAVKETGLQLPLVVRLEGNNVEAGRGDPGRIRPDHYPRRLDGRCRAKGGNRGLDPLRCICVLDEALTRNRPPTLQTICPSSSPLKPASWSRASLAASARGTRNSASPMAPRSSPASRQARAGNGLTIRSRSSTPWLRL